MEIEKDRGNVHPDSVRTYTNKIPKRSPTTPEIDATATPQKTAEILPKLPATYASEVSLLLGFVCVTIGLVGLAVEDFTIAHLGSLHAWLFVLTGAAALAVGFFRKLSARIFAYVAGIFYLSLGVAGFALGVSGTTTFGTVKNDDFLWNLIPNQLAFTTNDHILHLIIGAIFVAGASLKKKTPKSGVYF